MYAKPALTYAEQIALLAARGLLIRDHAFAAHVLAHHNYYRLSAYRFPLTQADQPDRFQPGVTFEQLWALYDFDLHLRELVLEACNQVEISVRSHWAYELGHRHGAQAYEDPQLFTDPVSHQKTMVKLDQELERSTEAFVAHFRANYAASRPPIWAVCEVMSFGQTSILYKTLREHSLRQSIANRYQLDEKALGSFLHHLNIVRNTCAHHGRLWNRCFTVTFQPPHTKPTHLVPNFVPVNRGTAYPGAPARIYNTLVMLAHLTRIIQPGSLWVSRAKALILATNYQVVGHMGFPADWVARPIWQTLP